MHAPIAEVAPLAALLVVAASAAVLSLGVNDLAKSALFERLVVVKAR